MEAEKVAARTIRRMKLNGSTYAKGRYLDLSAQQFGELAALGFIERAPAEQAAQARQKRESRRRQKPAS